MQRRARIRRHLWLGLAIGIISSGCGDREGSEGASATPADTIQAPALDSALAGRLPPGASFESAQLGQKLFITCAVCHGMDGRGTALGPSLRDTTWIAGTGTIEEIEQVIRLGVPDPQEFPVPMPVQGGGSFSDPELRALATYVYLLGHDG